MVNRVLQHTESAEPPELEQGSWYEVDGYETYVVTLETAPWIERYVEGLPEPRWIDFRFARG